MYIPLVVFNALATAVYLVLSSRVMKRSGLSPNATIATVHLSAAAVLAGPALASGEPAPIPLGLAFVWLLVTGGLKLLSKKLAFFAYAHADVANVSVFSAFIPIFGLAFGIGMLGERITGLEAAGTAVVCVSVYLLFLERKPGAAFPGWLFSPFSSLRSLPLFCAFLSTVPIALSNVYMKKSATIMGDLPFAFYSSLLIGLAALALEFPKRRPAERAARFPAWSLALTGAVFAAAQYSYVILISMERIAHTVAFQPLGIVFQMIIAYAVLNEREHPIKRLVYGTCIAAGCVLLELGNL